jgi:hypothetical protein
MFTDQDVEVVAGRMGSWSDALRDLAEPDLCRRLLSALDEGDGKAFHEIVDRWDFLGAATCIEIVETMTRFVHTGDYQPTRVCAIVTHLRPARPNPFHGQGYRLADGTTLWLSEADWWAMMDRAVGDEKWRNANADLLVAVGILSCHIELVPTVSRFDISKQYEICPPGGDPHAGRR